VRVTLPADGGAHVSSFKISAALIAGSMIVGSSGALLAIDREHDRGRKCEEKIHKAEDTLQKPFASTANTAGRRNKSAINWKKPESAATAVTTTMITTTARTHWILN